MKNGAIILVAVILMALVAFLSMNKKPSVHHVIPQLIKDINVVLYQLETDPDLTSARCYRDGDNFGIVLEYRFSSKIDKSKINRTKAEENLIKMLRSKKDIEEIGSYGIYFLVIYKDSTGTEIFKLKIPPEKYGLN